MGNREEAQTGDGGINKHSLTNSRFFKCQEHCSQVHNTFTHNSVCVFLAIVHPVTSDTGITILPIFHFTKWEFRTLPEKTVHSWFLDRNSSMCSNVLAILTKLFWLFTTNMLRNWNFIILCFIDHFIWAFYLFCGTVSIFMYLKCLKSSLRWKKFINEVFSIWDKLSSYH